MRYTIGKLAEIIDGDRGKNYPKQNEFHDTGYCLFLNTGNVTSNGFSFLENQFISEDKDKQLRKGKLQRGDIVYTTRGTVGNAAFYSDTVPYDNIRINSGMVILRCNNSIVDTRFLYQILKSSYYRPYFKKYCTGSAQPQLPIKNMSTIEIEIPAIDNQYRIADILSAYDNLIENNQKQIKLLEEAAQRLYKEWFVDLRFPGYEDMPIVDGVPEGWTRGSLCDLCTLKKDTINAEKMPKDLPYIGLEHLPRKDFCLSEWGYSSSVNSNKLQYAENDILFGKIRPYFHKVGFAINNGVCSTDCIVMKAKRGKWSYLLMTVFSNAFVEYSYQTCKEGSKMPRADWGQMAIYKVVMATDTIHQMFEERVKLITQRIKTLAIENRQLVEARDRLLPKLMNGDIAI